MATLLFGHDIHIYQQRVAASILLHLRTKTHTKHIPYTARIVVYEEIIYVFYVSAVIISIIIFSIINLKKLLLWGVWVLFVPWGANKKAHTKFKHPINGVETKGMVCMFCTNHVHKHLASRGCRCPFSFRINSMMTKGILVSVFNI